MTLLIYIRVKMVPCYHLTNDKYLEQNFQYRKTQNNNKIYQKFKTKIGYQGPKVI